MENYTPRYLTVEDLAAYLAVSTSYIYKLIEKGRIPHTPLNGKQTYRFDVKEIDEWMKEQTIKPRRKIPYTHAAKPAFPKSKNGVDKVQYIT